MLKKLAPYFYLARLHSLAGVFLLLLPSYWSLALNSRLKDSLKKLNVGNLGEQLETFASLLNKADFYREIYYYLIFLIGAICMRSFGCVINDIADRNVDKLVARTKNRPLAANLLSIKQALIWSSLLLIFPILIFLQFNNFAKLVALLSLIFLFVYPFTKRFFQAPQLVLGLTFNFGILLADAVVNHQISYGSWLLYLAAIFWTLAYDTIYAYQDYKDDKINHIKSLAVLLGEKPKPFIAFFYLMMVGIIISLGLLKAFNVLFFILLSLGLLKILYALYKLNLTKPTQCFAFFKLNIYLSIIIWIAFLLG
ncbi:4-hydroxybenzoate octaprenyltransferase [Candidatus Hepatincolaceae symbiont of Richtersius coronifer]